jgi:glycosyltransferase involved in cell wall biosynthesis
MSSSLDSNTREENDTMTSTQWKSSSPLAPVVSVSITAYNSATWLPRALDSVLKQRATFPIEIVIGDDCSQDATVSVAHSYREKYPDVIRVLERSKNVGIQRNYYETFEQCRGKFIAWLDADDYWTDQEKLAIQVETLESDPSISLCCHVVRCVAAEGEVKQIGHPTISAGRYGLEEILRHNFVASPSAVFRNGIHRDLPPWYFDLAPMTDWPIWVLAALSGDIVLLDNVMADYQQSYGSAFWGKEPLFWHQQDARFYEHIEGILPSKWHRLARAEKGKRYEYMAYALRQQGDFAASREAAVKAFCSPSLTDNLESKTKSLLAAIVREAEWRIKGRPTASGE